MTQTEAQTRKGLIDRQFQSAGWDVSDSTQIIEEFEIGVGLPDGVHEARTPYEGHQFSDYVLIGKHGKPLAVVEAKKTSKDAALGREQANNTATIFKKSVVANSHFAFTRTASKPTSGILEITPHAK